MRVLPVDLPGLVLLEPKVFGDSRGFFFETYSQQRYVDVGISGPFVQDNLSSSRKGVLRGLHFQHPRDQAKLVTVLQGEVFDVAVDIRVGSPTFGRWQGFTLSAENKRQLFVPAGFAHGFGVLSDTALFLYKVTDYWAPDCEGGLRWDDPAIGIQWPVAGPILSDKDQRYPSLSEIDPGKLPRFTR